jgi:hypothetical protein
MQETQTLKTQIISILDNLPLDSLRVLAEFALFLKTRVDWFSSPLESTPTATIDVPLPKQNVMRIASPHLVHRNQMADFKLEVIAESTE